MKRTRSIQRTRLLLLPPPPSWLKRHRVSDICREETLAQVMSRSLQDIRSVFGLDGTTYSTHGIVYPECGEATSQLFCSHPRRASSSGVSRDTLPDNLSPRRGKSRPPNLDALTKATKCCRTFFRWTGVVTLGTRSCFSRLYLPLFSRGPVPVC
jgi:hypothetical protein